MSVDFINLDKACLKDNFLDLIVDYIVRHKLKSFKDISIGYNQTKLNKD